MRINPVTLSRRLYQAARVRYLMRLKRALDQRRARLDKRLDDAATRAQTLASIHRFDPVLTNHRRALRVDRLIVDERLAVVNRRLRALGVPA